MCIRLITLINRKEQADLMALKLKNTKEIKDQIEMDGYNLRSFSTKSGISYNRLSEILKGKQTTGKTASKLSVALGGTNKDFFDTV